MKDHSTAYINAEQSKTRKPVELYRVWRNGGKTWYYTSGDVAFTYNGRSYKPAYIQRGGVEYDSDLDVSKLSITAAWDGEPFVEWMSGNPIDLVWVEVLKTFRDLSPVEAGVIFIGQIRAVSFKGLLASVECVGFEHYLSQPIPIYRYQPGCNNFIYDSRCGVNRGTYEHTIELSDVSASGRVLTSTGFGQFSDDYLLMGELFFDGNWRQIVAHSGNDIELRTWISGLSDTDTVKVYAGCDQKIETCRDRFSNVANYFGHPFIPLANPATRLMS